MCLLCAAMSQRGLDVGRVANCRSSAATPNYAAIGRIRHDPWRPDRAQDIRPWRVRSLICMTARPSDRFMPGREKKRRNGAAPLRSLLLLGNLVERRLPHLLLLVDERRGFRGRHRVRVATERCELLLDRKSVV